jgi:sugar phosphate isomerase/epimerase
MIIETAEQLAPVRPRYLVLDGGYVMAPGLNERQLQLDELLNCDECDSARLEELTRMDESQAEAQLDTLLRGLHRIAKVLAPLEICLLPPESPFGLLQPARMQHVFDDLGGRNVGYWHCTSNVAILEKLGGPAELDWIQRFGTRLRGVYLEDMLGGHGEQAPGLGEIDFEKLAPELAQGTIRVMVVNDDKGTKLRFGSEHLAKVGIF